jgi:threonine/homoserine/homoserine lactone efflux protein
MLKYLKPWFWGFICSFLGSLPLGSLNSLTIQIKYHETFFQALQFAVGIALAEIIHVSITLFSMKWILRNKKLFVGMQWFTIALFFAMAVVCFYSVIYPSGKSGNAILETNFNRFLLGFGLSLIDIIPIPFWFLWTTIFITKGRIKANPFDYKWYAFGIFIGTVACQISYMFVGGALINFFAAGSNAINLIVGCILIFTVVLQVVKILRGDKLFEKVEKYNAEHPE